MAPRARPVSARETAAHLGRLRGLDTLTDSRGIFALAAMDHRDSLRVAYEKAGLPRRHPSESPSSRRPSPARSRRTPRAC